MTTLVKVQKPISESHDWHPPTDLPDVLTSGTAACDILTGMVSGIGMDG